MEDPVLLELIDHIDKGERPDLRILTNYIQEKIDLVDPLDWAEFKEVVMSAYNLDDHQFRERLRAPVFFRDGLYYDDFREVMSKYKIGGFLRRYVDLLEHTESPSCFHFATALTMLGACMGRKIYFDQKVFKVWPAIQAFIFGPSGKTAKTTCTNFGMEMLDESGMAHRFAEVITPEGLRAALATRYEKTGEAVGLLYSSEMATLFTKQDSYNQGLIQTLTDFFDSRTTGDKETKTDGLMKVRNIALSFLACSNEGWAAQSIPESAFQGGFLGRSLLFYFEGPVGIVPEVTLPDPQEYQRLVSMLRLTQFIDGEFRWTLAGKDWYYTKYGWLKTNWPEDERTDPFWSRYGNHLLRLGMLFRVSEMIEEGYRNKVPVLDMAKEIDVRHFEQADAVLLHILQYIPRIYSFLGLAKSGEEAARILRYIARKGGSCTNGQLSRYMIRFMTMPKLDEVMKGLIVAQVLKREPTPPPHLDGTQRFVLNRALEEF